MYTFLKFPWIDKKINLKKHSIVTCKLRFEYFVMYFIFNKSNLDFICLMLKCFNVSIDNQYIRQFYSIHNAKICHLIFVLLLLSFVQGFENKASDFFLVKTQGVNNLTHKYNDIRHFARLKFVKSHHR